MSMPHSPDRRRFNSRERTALYLAADGRCTECGVELEPGWHADHMDPYSAGGPTDVINGQALCPPCNLRKGSVPVTAHDEWQRRAIDKFFAKGDPDFLICATPGAGKTTCSFKIVRRLLDERAVDRVGVVVPTDALRDQWVEAAAQFGIDLVAVSVETDYEKAGYQGWVATYQQLAGSKTGASLARRSMRVKTAVIIDEIHHAGDNREWGKHLREAAELAVYRIALTGTPWRKDPASSIPFVTYGPGPRPKVKVDSTYEYGQAVADGVCRRIEFHSRGGEATWSDPARAARAAKRTGTSRPASDARFTAVMGVDMDEEDVPGVLDTIYGPEHDWMRSILVEAVEALDDLRLEVPDAAGLVIAERTWIADEYAQILKELTGSLPPVVVSDQDDAKRAKEAKATINRFRDGRDKWIVAVKMISEGVDIKRLAVGVYASRTQTPLFFRQVAGRFVRVRKDEQFNALLFMPAIPSLIGHAFEIEEELRHQLELETKRDEAGEGGGDQGEFNLRQGLHASEATFDQAIIDGETISEDEVAAARVECVKRGIPPQFALNLAPLLRGLSAAATTPTSTIKLVPTVSRQRRETMLRGDVDQLAGKLSAKYLKDGAVLDRGAAKKAVNADLVRKFRIRRAEATVEQLEAMRDFLLERLSRP